MDREPKKYPLQIIAGALAFVLSVMLGLSICGRGGAPDPGWQALPDAGVWVGEDLKRAMDAGGRD